MFDPEFYAGAWQDESGVWQTSKYCDAPAAGVGEQPVLFERRLFYLVPVPGEAAWARPPRGAQATPPATGGGGEKRPRSEEDEEMAEAQPAARPRLPAPSPSAAQPSLAQPAPGRPAILKVYGADGADVRLNDVLEVLALLSLAPASTRFGAEQEEGEDFPEEAAAHNPPHSAVPRLHALRVMRAPPPPHPPPSLGGPAAREAALALLTDALGGDQLAARYTLLHLVSRVQARAEPLAVGALSLGLRLARSAGPGECGAAAEALAGALAALAPRFSRRRLSVASLNAGDWAPRKELASNRLCPGALQLAAGTHMLVDETGMDEGRLEAAGVRSLAALRDVAQSQTLPIDFHFYTLPLAVDIPLLLLSRGASLVQAGAEVAVRAVRPPAPPSLSEAQLAPVRSHLAACRALPHCIGAEVAAAVEADLVAARAADPGLDQSVFHRWLTLGRLLAASRGETELSAACWLEVREMERLAEERRRAEL